MKQKIPKLPNDVIHNFVYEVDVEKESLLVANKDIEKIDFKNPEDFDEVGQFDGEIKEGRLFDNAKKGDCFLVDTKEVVSLHYSIKEPGFKELSAAFSESMGSVGKLNMIDSGKVIWETCCVEHDEKFSNPRYMLGVCLDLYSRFVLPLSGEIKKK